MKTISFETAQKDLNIIINKRRNEKVLNPEYLSKGYKFFTPIVIEFINGENEKECEPLGILHSQKNKFNSIKDLYEQIIHDMFLKGNRIGRITKLHEIKTVLEIK